MLNRTRTSLLIALLIPLWTLSVEAHHSGAAVDLTRTVTVTGTVKEWLWANPHCWLYVIVVNDHGEPEQWAVEAGPVVGMARKGLRNTSFKPGDKVEVMLSPRKDGKPGGGLVTATLGDGVVFNVGPQFPSQPPPP